ncbi:MAG TPA: hypothetical protein DIW37_05665 [Chryseobacterium sp.]|nr:hypothetical protein [Chryseobacterium sp.]
MLSFNFFNKTYRNPSENIGRIFLLTLLKIIMMSTITIHTENQNQINLLKALLKELKINFEIDKEEKLTEWQKKQLLEGIDEADKGDFVNKEDARKILDQCFR